MKFQIFSNIFKQLVTFPSSFPSTTPPVYVPLLLSPLHVALELTSSKTLPTLAVTRRNGSDDGEEEQLEELWFSILPFRSPFNGFSVRLEEYVYDSACVLSPPLVSPLSPPHPQGEGRLPHKKKKIVVYFSRCFSSLFLCASQDFVMNFSRIAGEGEQPLFRA